jgi:SAM-dependent methyltransferase/tetratricopeptide (TPR) repeat protein
MNFKYISDAPDYRHLDDKERYKALYEEVGTVAANRVIRWREEWMKYFRPRAGSAILELGAHNGPNLLHYARLGHTVCGVELSAALIETFESALREEPSEVQARISLHRGWIEEFNPPARFDEVLCTEILEHVVDPLPILKVARAALKPGGRVYISSPTSHWGNNTHVRGVPVDELRHWLDAAGLTPIEIWSENDRTFCVAHASAARVIGMIRVRNESAIIVDTLDHMARFCSGGIYVYDDASTDNTAALCASHPMVREVVRGAYWDSNRGRAEYENRAAVLAAAQKHAGSQDWLVYLDADERVEFDWSSLFDLPADAIAVRMKLFDFYITAEDATRDYRGRNWMGPEYRPIIIAYRNIPTLRFRHLDQREVELGSEGRIVESGFVKHYGKAISVQQWEDACVYYSTYFPAYAAKWNARKGKAIHTHSDFGRDLIRWEDKETRGVPLRPEVDAAAQRAEGDAGSQKLSILLANHQLLDFTGSELFTFTLADFLRRLGHEVTVYSRYVDKLRQRFDSIRVPVVENLDDLRDRHFDVAHVHHNVTAMEVRRAFPRLPMVVLSHGVLPYLEEPPAVDLRISRFLAVSEEVRDALVAGGVAADSISLFRNIVDSQRFSPSGNIVDKPAKALIISARLDERRENIIREACAKLGIAATFLGGRFGEVAPSQLPVHINNADIVFSLGRGAIEAMMCGRIPVIFDYLGGDGMVTPENLSELMKCNFSGRRYGHDYSVDDLTSEIRKYRSENGNALRALSLQLFDGQINVPGLIGIYRDAARSPVEPLKEQDEKLLRAVVETIRETRSYTYNHLNRINLRTGAANETASLPLPATASAPEEWPDSIRHLESLLWLNEEDPSAHNELGLLHYHSGDKFRALGHFQRAAALLPNDEQIARNLRILYPELMGVVLSDLGGKTEHVQSLETHVRNLERDRDTATAQAQNLEEHARNVEERARNLEEHSRNLEARIRTLETHVNNLEAHARNVEMHAQNLEVHARNVEVHARNLEIRTKNLEVHAGNLEADRQRLQHWVDAQQQQLADSRIHVFAGRLTNLGARIRRDSIREIAVYGAGEAGRALISICRAENVHVRCVVDKKEQLWGGSLDGAPIVSPADAIKDGIDVYAVASFSSAREISREIRARYTDTGRRPRVYAPVQDPLNNSGAGTMQPAGSAGRK